MIEIPSVIPPLPLPTSPKTTASFVASYLMTVSLLSLLDKLTVDTVKILAQTELRGPVVLRAPLHPAA